MNTERHRLFVVMKEVELYIAFLSVCICVYLWFNKVFNYDA